MLHLSIFRFIVVRTKPDCEPKRTTKIVELTAKMLDERIVNFVVKQKYVTFHKLPTVIVCKKKIMKKKNVLYI